MKILKSSTDVAPSPSVHFQPSGMKTLLGPWCTFGGQAGQAVAQPFRAMDMGLIAASSRPSPSDIPTWVHETRWWTATASSCQSALSLRGTFGLNPDWGSHVEPAEESQELSNAALASMAPSQSWPKLLTPGPQTSSPPLRAPPSSAWSTCSRYLRVETAGVKPDAGGGCASLMTCNGSQTGRRSAWACQYGPV